MQNSVVLTLWNVNSLNVDTKFKVFFLPSHVRNFREQIMHN